MGALESRILVSTVFALASIPVVYYDQRDMEIPSVWFVILLASLTTVVFFLLPGEWELRTMGASVVLLAGTIGLFAFPGKLGEGDVLYLAAFPLVLGFFSVMFAVGAACAAGMAYFSWRALLHHDWIEHPLAFTPFLFWGALVQVLIEGSLS